ncbi:MAG: PilZ domain-containing protein [Acidimicrobiia bacterium]
MTGSGRERRLVPRASIGDVTVALDSPRRARRFRTVKPLSGRLLDASYTGARIEAEHDDRLTLGTRVEIAIGLATARGIVRRVIPGGEHSEYGIEIDFFDDQFRALMEGWSISGRMADELLWNKAH